MERVYVISMWSGGKAGRKWKSLEKPELLSQGTGVTFRCADTGMTVEAIGSISVEEYEQGKAAVDGMDTWPEPPGNIG